MLRSNRAPLIDLDSTRHEESIPLTDNEISCRTHGVEVDIFHAGVKPVLECPDLTLLARLLHLPLKGIQVLTLRQFPWPIPLPAFQQEVRRGSILPVLDLIYIEDRYQH